jgi:carbamoyltransferase
MNILGISCFYHDAAAALTRDGVLVAAAEEERFSRRKHDSGFPSLAIDFCLRQGGITAQDLDHVVFYEKPFRKFERLFLTILNGYPRSAGVFRDAMTSWLDEKLWIKSLLVERLGIDPKKILFSEHHLSHAASAFFCSPFKEAAILTVDGVGEWSTSTLGRGTATWDGRGENRINLFSEMRFPHSLGLLYSSFTAFLGFEVNEGEYKVMGMAPYGRALYVDKVMKLLRLFDDGSFELDLSYFSFHYHRERSFSQKFVKLFGPPRDPRARFVTAQTSLYDDPVPPTRAELDLNQYYADVAASVQRATEEIILKMARHLHRVTGLKSLCVAGGVALNSVANYRLLKETPFEHIYIQPAAGDAGGALGAALYVEHAILGRPRRFVMDHAAWGQAYGPAETGDFLRSVGAVFETLEEEDRLMDRVVEMLMAGKVVGWFQGRFEWGPRALGHRSILADPRRLDMKDIVNIKIKFREPFRPFAPSVVEERAAEFFDFPDPTRHWPPRFMLMVAPVRPEKRAALPAITHVDGTGRLQTVVKETNPLYHRLLTRFGEASGIPVLLNTSFNLRGEPIVTTPQNAFRTFMASGMDALVMGPQIVLKEGS